MEVGDEMTHVIVQTCQKSVKLCYFEMFENLTFYIPEIAFLMNLLQPESDILMCKAIEIS